MNENALKWVEALESGEYEQAWGCLRSLDGLNGYCCLGVACDIYAKDHPSAQWVHAKDDRGYAFRAGMDVATAVLPASVQRWLGLDDPAGRVFSGSESNLADMNDEGATFSEIAAFIRSEPTGLFA